MVDNPHQSPRSTGGGRVHSPIVSSLGLLADGLLLFVVGGALLNISYATRTAAVVAYSIGALFIGLSAICFLIPFTRWVRGQSANTARTRLAGTIRPHSGNNGPSDGNAH